MIVPNLRLQSLSELFGVFPSTLFGMLGPLEGWGWPRKEPAL